MLDEEGLRTSRSEAPRVEFRTVNDDRPSIRLVFTSSKLRDGQPFQEAAVTFGGVVYFHWSDFDHEMLHGNVADTGFGLLEITDSELVRQLAERDRNLRPPERLHGGGIDWEQEVHHYRIAFDDHGMYEVVCFALSVEFGAF
ncbi:MAG TPA: hypothetical protein VFT95_12675 [Micromonosporaceae bacterium]|nr:hypothetical protein [Micromonosporaceae bacterium]